MYNEGVAIIIAGCRDFLNYDFLSYNMDIILKYNILKVTIISGKARGTDSLGIRYANDNRYNLVEKPADWNKFGRRAGYIRNEEMANIAITYERNLLVAFWDHKSKGTKHMINIARNKGIPVIIIDI